MIKADLCTTYSIRHFGLKAARLAAIAAPANMERTEFTFFKSKEPMAFFTV